MPIRAGSPVIKFTGKILRETDRAVQFGIQWEAAPEYDPVWFPLSQVSEIHRTYSLVNNTLDSIIVSRWIAIQKDLIESEE